MTISLDDLQPLITWFQYHPYIAGFIVFLISLSESLAIVGLLIPGTVVMTAIGGLIGSGVLPAVPTLLWAIAGAIVGDGLSYWLGHYYHQQIRQIWPFNKVPGLLKKGEIFFLEHGGKSVFMGRFLGPVRPIIPVVAGMMNMQPLRFTAANVTSAIAWAVIYMAPGMLFGVLSQQLAPHIWPKLLVMLLAALLILWLSSWFIRHMLLFLRMQLHKLAVALWRRLARHPKLMWLAYALTNRRHNHGAYQIKLSFLWLLTLSLFIATLFQYSSQSWLNSFNVPLLNFFASLRFSTLDQFAVALTLFNQPWIMFSVSTILIIGLICLNYWRACWCFVLSLLLSIMAIHWLNYHLYLPQLNGLIFDPNFRLPPSCCTLLSLVVLGNITLLSQYILKPWQILTFISFCLLIAITPLYLQLAWPIDLIAAVLLAILITSTTTLIYYRRILPLRHFRDLLLGACILLAIMWAWSALYNYQHLAKRVEYTLPKQTFDVKSWWSLEQQPRVLYRQNRFGYPVQLLTIEWAATEAEIVQTLTKLGWQKTPRANLAVILNRLAANGDQQLPLLPQLYLGHKPNLILTKIIDEKFVVLRLWSANTDITPEHVPLWLGTISYHNANNAKISSVNPQQLLTYFLANFDWKRVKHPLPCINSIEDKNCDGHLFLIRSKSITLISR